MSGCRHRAGRRGRNRLRTPESRQPGLNYSIVTGTLTDGPRPGRNPFGNPATFLRVEFPVADPEHPDLLWTWASCDVEVSEALFDQHSLGELQGGAGVVVAGQLSERWTISGGQTSKRAVVVAALLQPGFLREADELVLPGCSPASSRREG